VYFYTLSVPGAVGYSVVEKEVGRYRITAAGAQVLADRVETTWLHTVVQSYPTLIGSCSYTITVSVVQ
jgi:hypothetical protein